jgi:eukaryotic-like serine/threonine-protein kinase
VRVTSGGVYLSPIWSPDGLNIVFSTASLSGGNGLFRISANGSGTAARLTESQNFQWATDWSYDGRTILYLEIAPGTQRDLWTLPATSTGEEGAKPQLYLQTPANEAWGRFSPEPSPRWVAYQSDVSGRYEVYLQSFPVPAGQIRISINGGSYPQWGPGGRELFYMSSDNKLLAATLKLGKDAQVVSRREVFALPPAFSGAGLASVDVAPDGERFLIRDETQGTEALTVVTNWTSLMKKDRAP